MQFVAEVATHDVDQFLRLLPNRIAKPAARRAANRAASTLGVLAGQIARDTLGIRQREFQRRKFVRVLPSVGEGAAVVIKGQGAPLEIFEGVRTTKRSGVRGTVAGKALDLRHAFLFQGKGGPIIVQRARKGTGSRMVGRGPVQRLYGPAPASLLRQPEIQATLEDRARERFHEVVVQELRYRLGPQAVQGQVSMLRAAGLGGLRKFVPRG